MRAMVMGWWVMTRKRVAVSAAIFSISVQKRSTLASSSGASTSSSTQIGDGLVRNTAKISAMRGQRLLAARQQRQGCRLLAGRLGDDLEPAFQRVLGLDHLEPRLAAAEQRGEQALEVAVDGVEGGLQAAAALVVDLGDAGAQLGDGRLDVGLLLVHALELLGEAGQVLVGLQVDAAQALAVGLEAGELAVGLLERAAARHPAASSASARQPSGAQPS